MYCETNIHVTLILHRTFKYIDEKSGISVTTKIIHLIDAKPYITYYCYLQYPVPFCPKQKYRHDIFKKLNPGT